MVDVNSFETLVYVTSIASRTRSFELLLTFLPASVVDKGSRLEFLRSGCRAIDMLLGGGLALHQVCFLYGEAATGKTILSMQFALEAARKDFKVFYVDSDQSFSVNRFENLVGGRETGDRIVLFRPETFEQQNRTLENLENLITKNQTLVVVDSINGLYRSGHAKSEDFFARDRELNLQGARLHGLAHRFAAWTLITGQVHSAPSGTEWAVEPVGQRTLRHWSDLVLKLIASPRSNVRECILEEKNGMESSGHAPFKITDSGIEDA